MKARQLKKLRIRRVDLVGTGANQEAHVMLFKSAGMPEHLKPEEEKPKETEKAATCAKCGEAVQGKFCASCGAEHKTEKSAAPAAGGQQMDGTEQVKKLQGDMEAAMTLAKEETDKRMAIEKAMKDQAETIAALKKSVEDANAEIKKAADAAKLEGFKKTVDAFEHLPVKADVFAPVLKACSEALSAEGYAELMRVLKAADAQGGDRFVEAGAPGNGSETRSAAEELQAKAEELVQKSAGKLDAIEAFARVSQENPKLAARARRESYAAPSRADN
jgi:hypothetical protein